MTAVREQLNLATRLARAERRGKFRAFLLVAPLLAFVLISFVIPIGNLVVQAAYSDLVSSGMPKTTAELAAWDGQMPVPEKLCELFVIEFKATKAQDPALPTRIATLVNREYSGSLSKLRAVINAELSAPYCSALAKLNDEWKKPEIWNAIKIVSPSLSPRYFIQSIDYRLNADGSIRPENAENSIHLVLFGRTLLVAAAVTLLCALLGFPISFLLAHLPARTSNLLMIIVLLPFWTSLLVRTTAWIALLQQNGVINDTLVALGLIADDQRPVMMYNMFATLIAMTHVLLPFMILPLYSVMVGIKPNFVRAARSLGATPLTAFVRIYFPLTVPGLGAGCLLVFILAIGYYITPALVGGQSGQLISNIIAFHMQKTLNWPLASAIGTILLVGVLLLYWLYNRIVGIEKMKFG